MYRLNLLVEEFENEFRRIFAAEPTAPPSTSTSMPSASLGVQESDDDSASNGRWDSISTEAESEDEVVGPYHHFWVHYWGERMREVLEEMNAVKMSAEQKRATEEIGVVWEDNTFVSSEVL
ncbi:armadillo-type protein [Apiospora arundinis]